MSRQLRLSLLIALLVLDDPNAANAVLDATSIDRIYSQPQNYPPPYNPGDYYYAEGWAVRGYGRRPARHLACRQPA